MHFYVSNITLWQNINRDSLLSPKIKWNIKIPQIYIFLPTNHKNLIYFVINNSFPIASPKPYITILCFLVFFGHMFSLFRVISTILFIMLSQCILTWSDVINFLNNKMFSNDKENGHNHFHSLMVLQHCILSSP